MTHRMFPRRIAAAAGAAVLTAVTAACSVGGSDHASGAAPGAAVLDAHNGPVEVEFWHSMKNARGTALEKLVKDFNAENSGRITVKPVYQGENDDVVAKYKAAVQQKATPPLVQIYDIGARFMIDSKQTLPAQGFLDADGADAGELNEHIRNYYTVNDKLTAMPFNASMPVLYINKKAFEEAGLDPEKPPRTLAEIAETAEKLTKKDSKGKTTRYGFGAAVNGWYVEQFLAQAGADYCNKDNGRSGPADKVLYGGKEGVQLADWWRDIVKKGHAPNTGRNLDAAQSAFTSGQVAMHLESTSVLGNYQDAAKFDFTTAPFPHMSADDAGGLIIGGGALWVSGPGHSPETQRAAWEFAHHAGSAKAQAAWHMATGYFPVNDKALEEPANKQYLKDNPAFTTAVDSLKRAKTSTASAGCLLGVMPQARQAAEEGLEKTVLGNGDGAENMRKAADSVQKAIDDYNTTVGK